MNIDKRNKNITLEDVMDKLEKIEARQEDLIAKYALQLSIKEHLQNESNIKTPIIKEIRDEIKEINNRILNGMPNNGRLANEPVESLIEEMKDREARRKNILVFGMHESTAEDQQKRESDDREAVGKLLEPLSVKVDLDNATMYKIGKFTKNKVRPIGVVLQNSTEAFSILKEKTSLPGEIFLKAEKNPSERRHTTELMEELKARKEQGENDIQIKYV